MTGPPRRPRRHAEPASSAGAQQIVESGRVDAGKPTARCSRRSTAPALLVRLSDPPRIFVLADDLDQEREARGVADLIAVLLAVLGREWEAAA